MYFVQMKSTLYSMSQLSQLIYKHQWRCIFLLIEVLMGNMQQRWITDCYNMLFFCNINFILIVLCMGHTHLHFLPCRWYKRKRTIVNPLPNTYTMSWCYFCLTSVLEPFGLGLLIFSGSKKCKIILY